MKVTKLIPQGYCKGVYNAIKITLETRNKYPNEKIYILGLIIHNKLITLLFLQKLIYLQFLLPSLMYLLCFGR